MAVLPPILSRTAYGWLRGVGERLRPAPAVPAFSTAPGPRLWLHAGTRAGLDTAALLLPAWRARHPDTPVLVTTASAEAYEEARQLSGVEPWPLPPDAPRAMRRFLDAATPDRALALGPALRPITAEALAARHIPWLWLVDRFLPVPWRPLQRLPSLYRRVLTAPAAVCAGREADAAQLRGQGVPAERVHITGDPVLDCAERADPAAGRELRVRLGGRPLLFALGVAPDEPEMLAGLCDHLPGNFSGWLLVIEPADPAGGPELAERLARFGLAPARAAAGEAISRETRVYILDDPAPRDALLDAADWVILGGTWVQGNAAADPRPAAARGKGILYGPYPHRHRTAIHALWEAGAAQQAPSANHLLAAMRQWLSHPGEADRAGRAGRTLVETHRGAAERITALLDQPPH